MLAQGTQVLFVVTICALINVNVLHSGNLELICMAGFVGFIVWFLIGTYFIYRAQEWMKIWYEYEIIANDPDQLDKIKQKHQEMYDKFAESGEIDMKRVDKYGATLEYLILRQAFINPMHLPVMSESYLRKDFNFALYLGYCYGKALTKLFKISMWTILLFFAVVILTNLVLEIMADTLIYGVC